MHDHLMKSDYRWFLDVFKADPELAWIKVFLAGYNYFVRAGVVFFHNSSMLIVVNKEAVLWE